MMRSLLVKLFAFSLVFFIAACGSDDDDETESGQDGAEDIVDEDASEEATTAVDTLRLTVDSLQLVSGSEDEVELTVTALDGDNRRLEGAAVRFATPDEGAGIQETRDVTDDAGEGQAFLTSPFSQWNRSIEVSVGAVGQSASDSINVDVVGTEVEISGPENVAPGAEASYTVTLLDGTGSPLPNETVALDSEAGNPVSPSEATTDSSGEIEFTITGNQTGTDTITASVPGASDNLVLNVSQNVLSFIDPDDGALIPINTGQNVVVEWLSQGTPQTGEELTISTSRGTVGGGPTVLDTTDGDGRISTTLQSQNAGFASITAQTAESANEDLKTTRRVRFLADEPSEIAVQALPRSVAPNVGGSTDNRSTIAAIVRDADGNLVSGAKVNFRFPGDLGLGDFSKGTATTDVFGRATTDFIAGEVQTEFEDVTIEASVVEESSIVDEVSLTIADTSFIRVGTAGLIDLAEDPRYRAPHSVQVTKVDGSPAANEEVSLTLRTTQVFVGDNEANGVWTRADDDDEWQAPSATTACINDDNQFGTAVLVPTEGTATEDGAGVLQLVTDDRGFADFDILYLRNEASWSEVEITASADVGDIFPAQSSFTRTLRVPQDAVEDDAEPPFVVSPYGSDGNCP